jgi:hypothetical protein
MGAFLALFTLRRPPARDAAERDEVEDRELAV